MTFYCYLAKDGWRWRLRTLNGRIIADSAEAYASERNLRRALRSLEKKIMASRDGIDQVWERPL